MSTQKLLNLLDDLMQSGYTHFEYSESRDVQKGTTDWLAAWDIIKELIDNSDSGIRSPRQFDRTYPTPLRQSVTNWTSDVEMELWNAKAYEERIQYVTEFLAHFPDIDDDRYVSIRRAEAEAHWKLGQIDEAEAIYRALVEKLPQKGWAYIGWSDQYYNCRDRVDNFERAEEILLQAIERQGLEDRKAVIERLIGLYEKWDLPEDISKDKLIDVVLRLEAEYERLKGEEAKQRRKIHELEMEQQKMASVEEQVPTKLGRNSPCWCGSGKKYKYCHFKSDG